MRILISGEDEAKVKKLTKQVFDQVKNIKKQHPLDFLYCEAMKSPVGRIEKKFRYQVLVRIKLEHQEQIVEQLYKIMDNINTSGIQTFIEVNPSNLS